MKSLPWTFLLLALGIVLIAGDGYFDGQTAVGILAILAGVGRLLFKVMVLGILSAAAAAVEKKPQGFAPPAAPRRR